MRVYREELGRAKVVCLKSAMHRISLWTKDHSFHLSVPPPLIIHLLPSPSSLYISSPYISFPYSLYLPLFPIPPPKPYTSPYSLSLPSIPILYSPLPIPSYLSPPTYPLLPIASYLPSPITGLPTATRTWATTSSSVSNLSPPLKPSPFQWANSRRLR